MAADDPFWLFITYNLPEETVESSSGGMYVVLAEELQYLSREDGQQLSAMCEGVGRALSGLINSLCGKVA
jgi:hypothetical protein